MKIGFACKYHHPDQSLPKNDIKRLQQQYNFITTTAKWMFANKKDSQQRLDEIVAWNANCVLALVAMVAKYPKSLRMVRIGSDVFPFYTHPDLKHLYKTSKTFIPAQDLLAEAGNIARKFDVKLSFHPGQFCVLASDRPHVIENSIDEFEYHCDIIRMMGFGRSKLDMKCNVHLSGKGGAEQFRSTYKRLSKVAKNVITLENDEYSATLDDLIPLADLVGIVLDVHHYWIYHGEYIKHTDPRLDIIEESWGDVRPTMHYSYSRAEWVDDVRGVKPDLQFLIDSGIPKAKLRAHSDTYPNPVANRYALEFLPRFDIMCEAKHKNEASRVLYEQAVRCGYL